MVVHGLLSHLYEGAIQSLPNSRTALVVDDDELLGKVVAQILHADGFEVRTADNGLNGFASYLRQPTEWVVTDIQMPELDGIEMMRRICAVNPAVKTIYMSGAVERYRSILDCEMADVNTFVLSKPFTRNMLIGRISPDEAESSQAEL